MRADLKGEVLLGTVMLATALLVAGGGLSQVYAVGRDVLGQTYVVGSVRTLGPLLVIMGLAPALARVAAAIVVDRRGPRWLMPLGALVAGVGLMLLTLTGSVWWLLLASLVTGLGRAGVLGVVLYGVTVKGCYRIRGTVIGILVFVTSLGPKVALDLFDARDPRVTALVFGGLALMAAVFLFRVLPWVFPVLQHPGTLPTWRPTPEDERDLTGKEFMQLPGLWKVTGMLILVFFLGRTLSIIGTMHLGRYSSISYLLPVATAFGALFWGVASDYFRARFLITAASLMAAVAFGLFGLLSEQAGMVGVVVIGLALGATHSLPWVLLADHVGVRFFATVGVAVSSVAGTLSLLPLNVSSQTGAPVVVVLAVALAIAAFRAPRLNFGNNA